MNAKPARKSNSGKRRSFVLAVGAIAAMLALAYAAGWWDYISLDAFARNRIALKRLVEDNPILAPVVFMAVHAVAVSFPVATIFKVMAGFLFGWAAGGVYAAVAATAGAMVLFQTTRMISSGYIRDLAAAKAGSLTREFEAGAFSYVLAMRLAPFVPFFAVSVVPALFDVRMRTFLIATAVGILPGALCFAWLGQGLDEAFEAASSEGRTLVVSDLVTSEITAALFALTLVAVLAAIVRRVWGPQGS
ncbi:MAG: TVP38/TMEM64 family protein [Mesorhizobium sp.]|nr:VTT domain-containing protein [Mesorhizobium sp.]MBL8579786.1 TVP38/TMEM64 family protein [Mesorhizobium sp.]